MNQSLIKDISLAEEGMQRIRWVEKFMPALNTLREDFIRNQIFRGKTIVMSIHLEAKTAYLALTLKAAGADVIVTGSNPLSTQDPIAAGLVSQGVTVYAWHGCTDDEYTMFLNKALDHKPHIIIDDGGDLVGLLHTTRRDAQENLIGGAEETTTGIQRLKNLEKNGRLQFPMIAVNDSYCKYLFDNRYGTGQSAWDGIIRSTNLTVTGKTVVIAGYGWCGKGCAMRAKGLGAHVIITEVDPIKAVEAIFDGFNVMPMDQAASLGDIFLTVTGDINVIVEKHFLKMKNGAICANAGHFDVEVSKKDLDRICVSHAEARKTLKAISCRTEIQSISWRKDASSIWRQGMDTQRKLWICLSLCRPLPPPICVKMRENWNRICISCRESSIRKSQRSNCIPWDMRSTC